RRRGTAILSSKTRTPINSRPVITALFRGSKQINSLLCIQARSGRRGIFHHAIPVRFPFPPPDGETGGR
ncbi:MAG TPA: hypothetical protein VKA67_12120, partial [Verrucomicrobiae bacterium]|nr:hypothetical protein [Verrucomicrobiae bacterium]